MSSKTFPKDVLSAIETALERELEHESAPVAAFDADGTLWSTDLGESFFKYQIENQLLANLPRDPWAHYREMKSENGDPRPAYLWLAQINQGIALSTVRGWAEANAAKFNPLPIFEEQRALIQWLHERGVRVYVVTASIKWAVEPGALRLGIPEDRVLGITTKIADGKITSEQMGTITYRKGKVEALLEATHGVKPFFCSGNSTGDLNLLQSATRVALAVRSAKPSDELFSVESELEAEAVKQKWLKHHFAR